MWVQQKIRHVI